MAENNQRFDSFQQWVNKASSWLTRHPRHSQHFKAICFDSAGRICLSGKEFARARDEKTFPVHWIWPDQNITEVMLALPPEASDLKELNKQMIEYLVSELKFNNPECDMQKLAALCCNMWTEHLIKLNLINTKKGSHT